MKTFLRKYWWLAPILVLDAWLIAFYAGCGREDTADDGHGCAKRREPAEVAPVIPPLVVTYPTAQTNLWATNDVSVYMPTASGRVQSAHYGSTRTRMRRGRAVAAFHEAIDIAPLRRDRHNRALDAVVSVADGRLVYANPIGGASSYGIYAVIEHTDPVGPIFTLYSHLSALADDSRTGSTVARGQTIGRMGNTSTLGIPRSRSHLHFEVGLMLNQRFDAWSRHQKIKHRHGIHHGWNLTGIDPLALYRERTPEQTFSMLEHLRGLPAAFRLLMQTDRPLDYFVRYPPLWEGGAPVAGIAVLAVSHGGVIIGGRPATDDEHAQLGQQPHAVIEVDTAVLGRNGPGLISRRNGAWSLTAHGERWVDILTF